MESEVDLVCRTVSEGVLACVSNEPDRPFWVYPVVIAVFAMALIILVLVARMTLRAPDGRDRRWDDAQPVRVNAQVRHGKLE